MTSKILWLFRKYGRKVWVRVVAYALLAVATVVVAELLSHLLPSKWSARLGADAVDQVLTIMSSSMLAVTTFSLSVAVSAFTAAAQTATPRATTLLQQDLTTQNVLATFLGAFIFSLLGLVALKAGYYTQAGEFVLFLATAFVIVLVVLSFLRWISHLMTFGRMSDTLDRVEAAASEAFSRRLAAPCMGGELQTAPPPENRPRVFCHSVGYVQHVDMQVLAEAAATSGSRIWVVAVPGTFVHDNAPLAVVDAITLEKEFASGIRDAFTIGRERSFEQDPRFGVVVLSEIAIRALSPAVNDPGTAIDVIGRLVRVLSPWRTEKAEKPTFADVVVPAIHTKELLEDAFRPIARDGAEAYEVHLHVQKGLRALCDAAPGTFRDGAQDVSRYALERGQHADLTPQEARRLGEIAPAPASAWN
jgi:uncharacterized membrane protein